MQASSSFIRGLALGATTALLAVISIAPAHAQTNNPPETVGLGGQIGDPSGITLKWYDRPAFAYDVFAAWDLDDFLFLNIHGLFERPIPDSPLNYFLGPGAFLGIDEGRGDEVVLGISGNFGLNFFVDRFEVFLQITPRLSIVPGTDGSFGGGVGLRYYF